MSFRLHGTIACLSLTALSLVTPALADECRSDRYVIEGVALDADGHPLRQARVHGVLDKVSKKKYLSRGIRARSTPTDGAGRFRLTLECGPGADGRPDPCGSRRSHLTLIVNDSLRGTTLRTLKLKDLDLRRDGDRCIVLVPPRKLGMR